jgi:hypothetical protein
MSVFLGIPLQGVNGGGYASFCVVRAPPGS